MYESTFHLNVDTAVKEKGAKALKGSDFIITINTNQSINCCTKEVIDQIPKIEATFKALLYSLFSKENLHKLLVQAVKTDQTKVNVKSGKTQFIYRHQPPPPGALRLVQATTKIEANIAGSGFLHSHTYIHTEHIGIKLQIDLDTMKKVIYKVLEPVLTFGGKFRKPYVNVVGVPNTVALKSYVAGS